MYFVLYVTISWQLFHAPLLLGAQSDQGDSKVNINGGGIHLRTGQFTVVVGAEQVPVWDQRKLPTGVLVLNWVLRSGHLFDVRGIPGRDAAARGRKRVRDRDCRGNLSRLDVAEKDQVVMAEGGSSKWG